LECAPIMSEYYFMVELIDKLEDKALIRFETFDGCTHEFWVTKSWLRRVGRIE